MKKHASLPFNRVPLLLLIVFSLIGIGVSLYLSHLHFTILKEGGIEDTLSCNFGGKLNCSGVLMSSYTLFLGIPLAGLGFIYYLYVLGATLAALVIFEKQKEILFLPGIISVVTLFHTAYLIYVSTFVLEAYCVYCISMYVVNLVLFIALFWAIGTPLYEMGALVKKVSWVKTLSYVLIVFSVGGFLLLSKERSIAKAKKLPPIDKLIEVFFHQTPHQVNIEGRPFWGNPNAKIVITEFSDFQCPFCKKAALNLKPMLSEFKDQIKLVYLQYPLDQSCNPLIQKEMHTLACKASFASFCAHGQGKFWPYHDLIFKNQRSLTSQSFETYAQQLHLDLKSFSACMNSETTRQAILQDIQEGEKLRVRGTPSVYLGGRKIGLWPYQEVTHAIVKEAIKNPQR